jgi:hypothetical protein
VAALVLAGCGAATSNGFSAEPPGGWKDETDNAETRAGTEFEAVYEGIPVQGVTPLLSVNRVKAADERPLEAAARAARVAVDLRFEEADPTEITEREIAGEPAFSFDYTAGRKRGRYVTARHDGYFYAVTLQAAPEGFHRQLAVLDDYLAGWHWEGGSARR